MAGGSKPVRAEDRGLQDSPRHDDEPEKQRRRAEACEEHAADSPELARALRLVRHLGELPVATAEIDAARERVRVRVFAAIAARSDGGGKLLAAHTAELPAPNVASTMAASRGTAGDRVRRDARRAGQGKVARRQRGPWRTLWRTIYMPRRQSHSVRSPGAVWGRMGVVRLGKRQGTPSER